MPPFVDAPHRANPDITIPGDRCFIKYRNFLKAWRTSPRWTTADMIASSIWPDPWTRAAVLAFLVFFCLYVMPYEQKKRKENGEVETE